MEKNIAYITTSLGSLSHTFIRREVIELRKLGMDISLFGIRPETAKELSNEERLLASETDFLYPLRILEIIFANCYFVFKKPGNYFKTFLKAFFNEERSIIQHSKVIYHFLVSSYLACRILNKNTIHIHAHFLNVPATIAMYCAGLMGISFSITVHSAGITPIKGMIGLRQKLREAKFICAVSEFNKEHISTNIYSCREKTYVVRCGIDVDSYEYKSEAYPTRHDVWKSALVSVGRFVEVKGFIYLIEAARLLKKANIGFSLNMIGEGPLKRDAEKLTKSYTLERAVTFRGALPHGEVKKIMKDSNIFIVSSIETTSGNKEGIPVVIMEAMASGIFVIATRHSGIPEIVRDKNTGMLVPERNPFAIAEAVKLALKDNDLRNLCIKNARKLVEKEYNVVRVAELKKTIFEKNI